MKKQEIFLNIQNETIIKYYFSGLMRCSQNDLRGVICSLEIIYYKGKSLKINELSIKIEN